MSKNKAFTLIELLVVIAIIGLISSIVLVSLNRARANSRDTRRMSDLKQIQIAMELFYDKYGEYPSESVFSACDAKSGVDSCNGVIGNKATDGVTDIDDALAEFMTETPADPLHDATNNNHVVTGNYYYFYDWGLNCSTAGPTDLAVVIFAKRVEVSGNANWSQVCGGPGGEGGANSISYMIILGTRK